MLNNALLFKSLLSFVVINIVCRDICQKAVNCFLAKCTERLSTLSAEKCSRRFISGFLLQTPCCNKVYTCRFCHDEMEDHAVNRKAITELICTLCETRQPVQADCQKCGIRFGKVSVSFPDRRPSWTRWRRAPARASLVAGRAFSRFVVKCG